MISKDEHDLDCGHPIMFNRDPVSKIGDNRNSKGRSRWKKEMIAFSMLEDKIVATRILNYFDPDRTPVIVCNEINHGMVEKEVLALLPILDIGYTMLVSHAIKALIRLSTLVWLVQSSEVNGRPRRCSEVLSTWTIEVSRCRKGEDEILGTLAASITPRDEVDEMLIAIAPQKQLKYAIIMPWPTVEKDKSLLVVSFDESARIKKKEEANSAIVWKFSRMGSCGDS
ncbi:unnamed protein product [Peronospora belbahrii]|uniref:Uncharacterized protein n=1 Tax=Peronospora belbahrii TaxID=622444 RepID=A0ABN8D7I6_9STRA|nr:unnamed protein product [Peronospora belbahrii]